MDHDRAVLARCVGDVERFAADHWGRSPLLRRAAGTFTDLLDLAAVEEVLGSAARRPEFRLVRDGSTLPSDQITTTLRLGGRTVEDVADPGRVGEALADGATLVLQSLQRTWPPLTRFCRSLERATSHPVQANAYLTPPGAAGLGEHADEHDVLVLQVEGTKAWAVAGLGEMELEPGDVLYLPGGTRHSASSQAAASLHLTVGLLVVTPRQVLQRVLAGLDDADLDRPLPLGYAAPEHATALRDGLAASVAAAAASLTATDVGALADAEARRAERRRKPHWMGQLRSVLAAYDLDDHTLLRRRADNPARIAPEPAADGRLVLDLVDRRLLLPPIARAALQAVLSAETLTVGDLAGIDEPSRKVLARRLVREGLLVVEG